MASLDVYMNGYLVGIFSRKGSGAHVFQYASSWLQQAGNRPISLSLPLQLKPFEGDVVYNFFDNLLPDNMEIRNRILIRYKTETTQPFDLLNKIGQDSVGALQLIPHGEPPADIRRIDYKSLSDVELESILKGYQSNIPLGMLNSEDDFRISIAGAQEKTALLKIGGNWCLPQKATPTTHIIKLPIGEIVTAHNIIDLSDSVENEFLCLLIAKAFGLSVPDTEIIRVGSIKALAVTRFDRRYSSDKHWIMRLPQEDFCQALNVPSARKYESQGGPGISQIMDYLRGSDHAARDRYHFMKAQVVFWLLAATDGHAKNFSLFIKSAGRYESTPLYDILSLYPAIGRKGLHIKDAKLAMGLTGSKGKKYGIAQIYPRHFVATAKSVGFAVEEMKQILNEIKDNVSNVLTSVSRQLPAEFPSSIRDAIFAGMQQRAERLHLVFD